MAKTIQQIKQDLTQLEQQVANIARELHQFYTKYIELLSRGVEKQLVLASYRLCTQKYPQAFLRLSLKQRETLQQTLRQIGQQLEPQLFSGEKSDPEAALANSGETIDQEIEPSSLNSPSTVETDQTIQLLLSNNPEYLLAWQQQLEASISKHLDKISTDANLLLQQAKIIPNQLPAQFMQAAIEAEKGGVITTGLPNLLNVVVEAKKDSQAENAKVIQITAIRLRLAEIEFADTNLTACRHQIRNILARLATVHQHYQKKQKELLVAEAEAAWRATWYEK